MMEIYLHNTLSGQKEKFSPLEEGKIKMYHCGPTVYDFAHIGNMRSYVLADTLRRTFEYFGYDIKQVINITDVGHLVGDGDEGEDKILGAAKKEGKTAEEIAKFYEDVFREDLVDLNVETSGTKFPKATENIKEQIEIIKILEEKGFTYTTSDGVYFDTGKFPDYGKLGNINLEGQREGTRAETGAEKKHPSDFALWKFSKSSEGERLQEWESPWGVGFPGWHIECSAMSKKYLGQPFDIHTGGIDHIPVHHNNEIAQSESAFATPLANYWLHNEFLKVNNEKMSKSLGNIFTLADLKKEGIHPLSYRYWLLTSRYNTPSNFTWEAVNAAQAALEKVVNKYTISKTLFPKIDGYKSLIPEFERAISDDLNTPVALSLLQQSESRKEIEKMDEMLGLNIKKLSEQISEIPEEIKDIQKERERAREAKDFSKSDSLREEIESRGYYILDADKTVILRKLSSLT